jgi:hypothetical protein
MKGTECAAAPEHRLFTNRRKHFVSPETESKEIRKIGLFSLIQSENFTRILKKLFAAYQDQDSNLEVCNVCVTRSPSQLKSGG